MRGANVSGILGAQQGRFGRVTLFDIRDPVADHAHPHVHLLFKVGGSDRGLKVGAELVSLRDDACVLVSPWQRHADVEELCVAPTVMLALYLDTAYLEQRFGKLPAAIFAKASSSVSPLTRRLVEEISGILGGNGASERLEDAILDLVVDTLHQAGSGSDLRTKVSDYRIRRAMAQLSEHPHLHPDLELVASSVGLSRSRFFEQFKNAVGIAPTMYVDGLLLEEAIVMLASSDRSIEDISQSLGFAAQSSFSRFFKDRVGFPPNVLRHAVASN
jgi:AraC family transcriptional regulator